VLQEISIDATNEQSNVSLKQKDLKSQTVATLKALRRLSFLVPLGDILPEALLVFRRKGVLQLCCRFCFTTSQNNQWIIISPSFCIEGYYENGVFRI